MTTTNQNTASNLPKLRARLAAAIEKADTSDHRLNFAPAWQAAEFNLKRKRAAAHRAVAAARAALEAAVAAARTA